MRKFLLGVWEDIRRGENIDVYLTTYHSRNRLTKVEFPGKLREWQPN